MYVIRLQELASKKGQAENALTKNKIEEIFQCIDRKAEKQDLTSLRFDFEKYADGLRQIEEGAASTSSNLGKIKIRIEDSEMKYSQLTKEISYLSGLISSKADKITTDIHKESPSIIQRKAESHERSDYTKPREANKIEEMFKKVKISDPETRAEIHQRALAGAYHSYRLTSSEEDKKYENPPIKTGYIRQLQIVSISYLKNIGNRIRVSKSFNDETYFNSRFPKSIIWRGR